MNILKRLSEMRNNNWQRDVAKMTQCLIACGLMLVLFGGNAMAQGNDKQVVIKKNVSKTADATTHYLAHVKVGDVWQLQDATTFNPATCLWYTGSNYNRAGTDHNYYFIDDASKPRFLSAPISSGGALSITDDKPATYLLSNTDQDYYFYDWDKVGLARGHKNSPITSSAECTSAIGDWDASAGECWLVYWVEYDLSSSTWKMTDDHSYNITDNAARAYTVTATPHDIVINSSTGGFTAVGVSNAEMNYGDNQNPTVTITPLTYNHVPAYTSYVFQEITTEPSTTTASTHNYYNGSDLGTSVPGNVNSSGVAASSYEWTLTGAGAEHLSFDNASDVTTITTTPPAIPTIYYRTNNTTGHKTATLTLTVTFGTGASEYKQTHSVDITVKTSCHNPAQAAAPDINYEGVTVSWYPTSTSYNVSLKESGGSYGAPVAVGNVTSYTFTGLAANTTYYYKVAAVCGGGEGDPTEYSFTTKAAHGLVVYGSIFGGGRMADVNANKVDGKTEVVIINCDTIGAIYGGNDIAGTVQGSNGSIITLGVNAGNSYATTYNSGNASTKIKIGSVYGGGNGYYAYNGTSFVAASASTVSIAASASVKAMTREHHVGSTVWTNGASPYTLTIPSIVKTNITVTNDAVKADTIFGGAKNAFLTLDNAAQNGSTITIDGGTIFAIFGGNNFGGSQQAAKHHIDVNGTKTDLTPDIANTSSAGYGRTFGVRYLFGGGNMVPGSTTEIAVTGGQVDTLFGGGNRADVAGANITVYCSLTSGSDKTWGNTYSNAISSYSDAVVIKENYTWNGTGVYNVRTLFGGNNAAHMSGLPTITLTSGSVGTVYGGGNEGDMLAHVPDAGGDNGLIADDFGSPEVATITVPANAPDGMTTGNQTIQYGTHVVMNSPNMLVDYLYGGCQMSSVKYSTWVEIKNGHVGTVYGGCNISGDVGSNYMIGYSSGMTGEEYQYVKGATYVKASGGTVYGNIFAGSNGLYHCNDAVSYVSGIDYDDPEHYYIGLEIPTHNETHVMVSGNVEVNGNVYAGGNMAPVGFINESARGYTYRTFVGFASVRMNGGTVNGSVYGGGNMASIYGSNEVKISGGKINGALYGGNDRAGQVAQISNRKLPSTYDVASDQETSLTALAVNTYVSLTGRPDVNTVYGGGNGAYTYTSAEFCDVTDQPIQTNTFVDINIDGFKTDPSGPDDGGHIETVYGGGNGVTVTGGITVLLNVKGNGLSAPEVYDHVGTIFGGNNMGNLAIVPDIVLLNGQVNTVYGGCNQGAMVGGKTVTAVNGDTYTNVGSLVHLRRTYTGAGSNVAQTVNATVSGNVYGGCRMNGVSNNSLVLVEGGTHSCGIFGGSDISGTISGTSQVAVYAPSNVRSNIYGGGNGNYNYTSGPYSGMTAPISNMSHVYILGGQVGTALAPASVFGGGFGAATTTTGNVTVTVGDLAGSYTPTIYGDIYGGSALGSVNNEASDITTVEFLNGTLTGNIFGGGMGDAEDASKGKVYGKIYVNIGGETQTEAQCKIDLRNASVYGCNNTNGSPQDDVEVHIWRTKHWATDTAQFYQGIEPANPTYAIHEVFGGGKNADYLPENALASSTKTASIYVHNCHNSIERVFAGGDAADATGVGLTIDGGRFDYVFGGGNGESVAANIGNGGTNTVVNAGIINHLFGGSNKQGSIDGTMNTTVNKTGSCIEDIREFFAGGNLAAIVADLNTTINCNTVFGDIYGGSNMAGITGDVTLTINGGTINNVYGGSKGVAVGDATYPAGVPANINGDVTLNIYGGDIGNAFGGSNINGDITGVIAVNMDWSQSDCLQKQLDNIYGASNLATYTPTEDDALSPNYSPLVTLVNGQVGRTVERGIYPAFIPSLMNAHGRVFGAGKGDANVPNAGRVTANPKVHLNADNTNDVIVLGSVFGGGEVASVTGNTLVQIDNGHVGCDERDLDHDNGFVFGGGMGDTDDPELANISGNAKVVMTGGYVHNTVFGGGQIAAVGTFTRADASYVAAHPNDDVVVGEPVSRTAGTGTTMVDISGGQVGPHTVTMEADLGYVFGAGMGYYTQPGVDYTDATINGLEAGRQNAKFGYVDSAEVRISGTAFIVGAVWGGSENGQVLHNCGVKVSGGQIGCGDGESAPYSESLWTAAKTAVQNHDAAAIKAVSAQMKECKSWNYADPYLPYDAYIDDDIAAYGLSITHDASTANAGDGHTFFGNVFGGGSGYYPYRVTVRNYNDTQDSTFSHFYRFQGRVRGNTRVEITGGHILTSVYGGCEYADVTGSSTVKMTGGTLGIPRTVEDILNHPVTCYLFGAGKGDQRTTFNLVTNVENAYVTIGGDAVIYGSVFGGGEDGHVNGNTTVTIQDNAIVGTWGTSYYDGNIFGGGRGFGGTSLNAGSIGGNDTVTIAGACKILGNIYGGGRLASVGVHFVNPSDPAYGFLQGNYSGDSDKSAAFKAKHGNVVINISGGTIGSEIEFNPAAFSTSTDYVAGDVVLRNDSIWRFTADHSHGDWNYSHAQEIEHTTGGNVFGGSMGRLFLIDGTTYNHLWPGLAKCRSTVVTVNGTARIFGNVYGGGELGYVMDSTNVIIGGTAEIGYGIGTLPNIRYTGSVYGGGYGSSDITPHVNDSLSINVNHLSTGTSVTAAMHAGRVYGNTRVTMNNGQVWGNVYGGGEMASVGRRWINMSANGNDNNYLPYVGTTNSSYTARNWNNTADTTYTIYAWTAGVGNSRVSITGGAVGNITNTTIGTHREAGWVAGKTGGVFGGGKGHPGRVGEDFHFTRMAYVDSAEVTISGTAQIAAVVFGGSENGHVRYGTNVRMTGGSIGLAMSDEEKDMDLYGYSPVVVYQGNVYGGGRGVDVTESGHLGDGSGQVYGNTRVTISSGSVSHNVYGGGSLATVGTQQADGSFLAGTGNAIVIINGDAAIGDPAAKGHNSGRVFGSGRGVAAEEFASRAYTNNTYVTIDGTCHIYGCVFGSGENGRVKKNTYVTINGGQIGEYWGDLIGKHNDFIGNVYGGGRGIDPAEGGISRTAGLVHGATHVKVSGGKIYHNIYGGGSLANVGDTVALTSERIAAGEIYSKFNDTVVYDYDDYKHTALTADAFDAATANGHSYIFISGGKIGIDGNNNGRVFGGGRGNAGHSDYTPFVDPLSTTGFESGSVTIGGNSYTIYYKTLTKVHGGDSVVSYRVSNKSEFHFDQSKAIWVLGKVRTSTSIPYEDSVVVRDYTNHTYVTGTHIVVQYPSVDSTTVSTSYSNYDDSLTNAATNTASLNFIRGSVFGGGDNGHVRGNTEVFIQQGRIGTLTSRTNGNVFGGGRGRGLSFDGKYSDDAGKVYGNTNVTVNGGWILHNVYGGGDLSSVGEFTVTLSGAPDGHENDKDSWLRGEGTVAGYTTSGGTCYVNILGGHIGEKYGDIMQTSTTVKAGMDGSNPNLGGFVYGSSRGEASNQTLVNRMAYTNQTVVNINNAQAQVTGSVFGGGENGHIFYTATVNMVAGTVGVPNTAASGDIYRGNLYGGGRGIDPVDNTGFINRNSGLILGNAYVNMTGGRVFHNVFGGGSLASVGTYTYDITNDHLDSVTVLQRRETGKIEVTITGGIVGIDGNNNGRVFGAGRGVAGTRANGQVMDRYTYVDRTYVTIGGAADIRGSVFGSGDNGHVQHNTQVVVYGGTIGTGNGSATVGNVFGSGRGADTYLKNSTPTLSPHAGRVYGNTDVYIIGGTIKNNVYGGGYLATVDSNTTVTIATTATVDREGYTYTGSVPSLVTQSVTFPSEGKGNPVVWGDVFGGSALGELGYTGGRTTLDILGGTIGSTSSYYYIANGEYKGNIFGGGNGDGEGATMNGAIPTAKRAANVHNTVQVNIGNPSQYHNNALGATIKGSVFGGNNVMGSPKGDIYVDVYSTAHTAGVNDYDHLKTLAANIAVLDTFDLDALYGLSEGARANMYALAAVYGGGNKATVIPSVSGAVTNVTIHECYENTVYYVYGGGNAADLGNSTYSVNTNVVIEGGSFYQVFAGGNGYSATDNHNDPNAANYNPGANIYGDASITIEGGAIYQVFGGSNSLGMIHGVSSVNITEDAACPRIIKQVYGGGNEADGGDVVINLPCMDEDTYIPVFFAGANAADIGTELEPKHVTLNVKGGHYGQIFGGNNTDGTIWGNVTVNIFGGEIHEVFGGSNLGGDIKGQIIVNIDSTGTGCPLNLDYVYGGGNEVAYAPTFSGVADVSPEVNVLQGTVNQTVFGGGKGTTQVGHDARVTARPTVNIGDDQNLHVLIGNGSVGELMGMVFGGGNIAPVTGSTQVVVRGDNTKVTRNVYGGGNGLTAIVSGSTDVTIGSMPEGHTPTAVGTISATVDQDARTVELSSATRGAVIRYTLDGTDPLNNPRHLGYSTPISVTGGNTLRAVATRPGYTSTSEYTISSVATPVISVDGGNVTISCATDGSTVYFTTDGSEPTTSSSTYSTTISGLAAGTTVKAIAVKAEMVNSATATVTL